MKQISEVALAHGDSSSIANCRTKTCVIFWEIFEIFRNFRIFIFLLAINPSQRLTAHNTQHLQETGIRIPGEIPTHDLIKL